MSKNETAAERLARMKKDREAAMAKESSEPTKLVEQLTHNSDGEPDFSELAKKLKKRQDKEKKSALTGAVKYTIYIDEDVAEAFQALCLKRGDQRRFANEAFVDFVKKKARELDI